MARIKMSDFEKQSHEDERLYRQEGFNPPRQVVTCSERRDKRSRLAIVRRLGSPLYPLDALVHSVWLHPASMDEVMQNLGDDAKEIMLKPTYIARFLGDPP